MSKIQVWHQNQTTINLDLILGGKFKSISISCTYSISFYDKKVNYIRFYLSTNKGSNIQINFPRNKNFKQEVYIYFNSIKEEKLMKYLKNKIFSDIDYSKIDSTDKFLHFLKNRLTRAKSRRLLTI